MVPPLLSGVDVRHGGAAVGAGGQAVQRVSGHSHHLLPTQRLCCQPRVVHGRRQHVTSRRRCRASTAAALATAAARCSAAAAARRAAAAASPAAAAACCACCAEAQVKHHGQVVGGEALRGEVALRAAQLLQRGQRHLARHLQR